MIKYNNYMKSKLFFGGIEMKKLTAILLSLLMIVMGLCACGTQKTGGGSETDKEAEEKTSYDNLAVAAEITSEEYGIAFRKGSDLTAAVNEYMDELIEDGTLKELADKYELVLADSEAQEQQEAVVKDIDYVKGNGKLIIGITDYEPMNYRDKNGEWTGFDTEFALKVCEKLGVEAEFVEIDWDNKFLALESKTIDCIWNGMTISDEVLKNTSCTKAYVKNAQVVVMDKDKIAEYTTPGDMKDLSFAVEAGSAGAAAAKENGFENIVEAGAQTDALLEVASGSCDACIIDLTMANAMLGAK